MSLDKVPVSRNLLSPRSEGCISLTSAQPSSEEARDLHDLMTQVVDKGLKQIQGEEIVHMRDTEVGGILLIIRAL
jgi:acyl-coenzyme A thioesterase 9